MRNHQIVPFIQYSLSMNLIKVQYKQPSIQMILHSKGRRLSAEECPFTFALSSARGSLTRKDEYLEDDNGNVDVNVNPSTVGSWIIVNIMIINIIGIIFIVIDIIIVVFVILFCIELSWTGELSFRNFKN